MSDVAACRSCGAAVLFRRADTTGGMMCLEAEPSERGNVEVLDERTCRVYGAERARLRRAEGVALHVSHHVGCPERQRWTRGRATSSASRP